MKYFIGLFVTLLGLNSWALSEVAIKASFLDSATSLKQAKSLLEYHDKLNTAAETLQKSLLTDSDVFRTCATLHSMSFEEISKSYDLLSNEKLAKLSCRDDLLKNVEDDMAHSMEPMTASEVIPLPTTEMTIADLKVGLNLPSDFQFAPKTVAFTFDDGPHPRLTEKLLEILKAYNVTASFFMVGENTKAYPNIVKEVALAGHGVGGHSMTHPQLTKMSYENAVKEMVQSLDVIHQVLGFNDPFFRFPYGASNQGLKAFLRKAGVDEFYWSIDTMDWKNRNPAVLLPYAIHETESTNHGIILFHDIQPQTIAIMPAFLDRLAKDGYKTVVLRSSQPNLPQQRLGKK